MKDPVDEAQCPHADLYIQTLSSNWICPVFNRKTALGSSLNPRG